MGREDPLVKEMATHSSIFAWKTPWTEETGGYCAHYCQVSNTTEWVSTHNLTWRSQNFQAVHEVNSSSITGACWKPSLVGAGTRKMIFTDPLVTESTQNAPPHSSVLSMVSGLIQELMGILPWSLHEKHAFLSISQNMFHLFLFQDPFLTPHPMPLPLPHVTRLSKVKTFFFSVT